MSVKNSLRNLLLSSNIFSTSFTSSSIASLDLSSNKFCTLLRVSAPPLEHQRLGVKNEKQFFSSMIIETELVASKPGTGNSHFPSSKKFTGGLK